ncbi:MAG: acetolactate synthase small subunit [Clostridiales bacterium]|uniref:Acetolactate synthase small subunit n=1 Tax=Candidatus Scybalenecus merdavium TaxID=2840939 RepID=A0A9D1SND1_9FIRM|nr:acetolactate synthase small subunit [Clostridiales bacterium]HIU69004.1 acetolactate synthase small subunit [Candidatus Scubalenecus merdavium]
MDTKKRLTLSVLVENSSGVLQRVVSLFTRRGFNIDSLTVSETEDPQFSRMTIDCITEEENFRQIEMQLLKLEVVRKVVALEPADSIFSELLLIKVHAEGVAHKNEVLALNQKYGARTRDISLKSLTLEFTGTKADVDEFIAAVEPFGIIEMARTGVTALKRGGESIIDSIL